MKSEITVAAADGAGFLLSAGQTLRIIDVEGGQSGDLMAFATFFMVAVVPPDGKLSFEPPRSKPGDALTLRAGMDLRVAVTSCPAGTCNGGAKPKPLAVEIAGP